MPSHSKTHSSSPTNSHGKNSNNTDSTTQPAGTRAPPSEATSDTQPPRMKTLKPDDADIYKRRRSSCSDMGDIVHHVKSDVHDINRLSIVTDKMDEIEEAMGQTGGASPFAIIFNMCKASTSNGILSTPLVFALIGPYFGIAMIAWSAFIYGFGYFILGIITQKLNATSYADIWAKSISPRTTWVVDLFQIGNGFASCLSFCMVYGNIFAQPLKELDPVTNLPLADQPWYATKQFWILVVGWCIVFPVCLPKKLAVLRHTSLLGIVCILFGMGYVAAMGFGKNTSLSERWRDPQYKSGIFETQDIDWKWIQVFSLLGSAFTGHMNGPRYFYEMKDKSTKTWAKVCIFGHIGLFIVNVFFGLAGLACFGGEQLKSGTKLGNVADNAEKWGGNAFAGFEQMQTKPDPRGLYYAVMFCVAFSLLFALPLSFIGARQGLISITQAFNAPFSGEGFSRVVITICGLAFVFLISCLIDDLTYVNIIKGMVFSISLSSTIPAIIWLNLGKAEFNGKCDPKDEEGEPLVPKVRAPRPFRPKWMTVCAWLQICQASVCLITGVTMTVYKLFLADKAKLSPMPVYYATPVIQ